MRNSAALDQSRPRCRPTISTGDNISTIEAQPYYEFFATETEARLAHRLWTLAFYGWKGADIPFPGDKPSYAKAGKPSAGGVFEILHQVDLSEYASRFTALRPTGPGTWKGLCPLHNERTASFYIWSSPWRWRCFGCASGGDIVALARDLKHKERPL